MRIDRYDVAADTAPAAEVCQDFAGGKYIRQARTIFQTARAVTEQRSRPDDGAFAFSFPPVLS